MYNDNAGKLVVRLTLGILILFHGVDKILHPDSLGFMKSGLASWGLPEAVAYGVYIGEVVAPLLLILGVYSRWCGMLVVVNMLFAIGLAHMGHLFALTDHGGYRLELQMFYLFGGLAVMFLGSGRYAVRPD
ncbi:MAG: DoxX family protein [Halobacteria archaeon]|nr:DoxX family protein [Halobacteria archaeon]